MFLFAIFIVTFGILKATPIPKTIPDLVLPSDQPGILISFCPSNIPSEVGDQPTPNQSVDVITRPSDVSQSQPQLVAVNHTSAEDIPTLDQSIDVVSQLKANTSRPIVVDHTPIESANQSSSSQGYNWVTEPSNRSQSQQSVVLDNTLIEAGDAPTPRKIDIGTNESRDVSQAQPAVDNTPVSPIIAPRGNTEKPVEPFIMLTTPGEQPDPVTLVNKDNTTSKSVELTHVGDRCQNNIECGKDSWCKNKRCAPLTRQLKD